MKLNFKISEFNISGEPIPEDVADKILKHHILPMQKVRELFGQAIWPSQKSGYRSVKWEKEHGRSGNSQHTFKGKGAVDWTCKEGESFGVRNLDNLLHFIIEETDYKRIAVYKNFIHCDYKSDGTVNRYLYDSTPDSKWTLRTKF